ARHGDVGLVLSGITEARQGLVEALIRRLDLGGRVLLRGYVPRGEVAGLYHRALALVFPSLYEGFGLPVLEAQACGTPVLTSSVSALPEAAGDGALLVDPYDVEAIAEGLHRLLTDKTLRETLRERGREHAARFSWPRTAAETVAVYQEVIAGGKP
ncbi:MAG: glycosyltransferase family 4 protein, partial [Anaerolineae bacterium]|nr:glycosyltransferase family 4 protein [Anaerolineae bacterium]